MHNKGHLLSSDNLFAIGRRLINTEREIEKSDPKRQWHLINWKKTEEVVKDLQEKIVIAKLEENTKEMYKLQWKLLTTFEAKALAVRKVITNQGGKTAGTDNITWKGPKDYWYAIEKLKEIVRNPTKYRAQPLRRVWIPKTNSKELRPLGIPTLIDRAVQAVYHLGVDPIVETKSRSTQDAITAVRAMQ